MRDLLVVFPNAGHEAKGAFIVYRFVSGAGQVESAAYVDRLLGRAGYTVTKID